jgi:hypothetical protein
MAVARLESASHSSHPHSALAALQEKIVCGVAVSESDLTHALTKDIESGVRLSEVFLSKFSRTSILSQESREALIARLQARMSQMVFTDPAAFLNYGKAAVILTGKLPPSC